MLQRIATEICSEFHNYYESKAEKTSLEMYLQTHPVPTGNDAKDDPILETYLFNTRSLMDIVHSFLKGEEAELLLYLFNPYVKLADKEREELFGLISNLKEKQLDKSIEQREQVLLGFAYLNGFGVNENYALALECFEKSNKDREALLYLGIMHQNGLGVTINFKKAQEFYIKSIALGSLAAFSFSARMNYVSLMTQFVKDTATYQDLLMIAVTKGSSIALQFYASIKMANEKYNRQLLELGAMRGNPMCLASLAGMLSKSDGVKSHLYLDHANNSGCDELFLISDTELSKNTLSIWKRIIDVKDIFYLQLKLPFLGTYFDLSDISSLEKDEVRAYASKLGYQYRGVVANLTENAFFSLSFKLMNMTVSDHLNEMPSFRFHNAIAFDDKMDFCNLAQQHPEKFDLLTDKEARNTLIKMLGRQGLYDIQLRKKVKQLIPEFVGSHPAKIIMNYFSDSNYHNNLKADEIALKGQQEEKEDDTLSPVESTPEVKIDKQRSLDMALSGLKINLNNFEDGTPDEHGIIVKLPPEHKFMMKFMVRELEKDKKENNERIEKELGFHLNPISELFEEEKIDSVVSTEEKATSVALSQKKRKADQEPDEQQPSSKKLKTEIEEKTLSITRHSPNLWQTNQGASSSPHEGPSEKKRRLT